MAAVRRATSAARLWFTVFGSPSHGTSVAGRHSFSHALPPIRCPGAPVLLVLCLVLLCRSGRAAHIPNDRVRIVRKALARQGSVTEGRIIALDNEAGSGRHPARRASTCTTGAGSFAYHRCRRDGVAKARSATSTAATPIRFAAQSQTAGRVTSATTSGTRALPWHPGSGTRPARRQRASLRERRLRHQPVPVRRHHRHRVYRLDYRAQMELETLISWQKELRRRRWLPSRGRRRTHATLDSKCWRPSRWTWCRAAPRRAAGTARP